MSILYHYTQIRSLWTTDATTMSITPLKPQCQAWSTLQSAHLSLRLLSSIIKHTIRSPHSSACQYRSCRKGYLLISWRRGHDWSCECECECEWKCDTWIYDACHGTDEYFTDEVKQWECCSWTTVSAASMSNEHAAAMDDNNGNVNAHAHAHHPMNQPAHNQIGMNPMMISHPMNHNSL